VTVWAVRYAEFISASALRGYFQIYRLTYVVNASLLIISKSEFTTTVTLFAVICGFYRLLSDFHFFINN
jgi:hypothetical protein